MSDERLRELERRFHETGDPEDMARWERALERSGGPSRRAVCARLLGVLKEHALDRPLFPQHILNLFQYPNIQMNTLGVWGNHGMDRTVTVSRTVLTVSPQVTEDAFDAIMHDELEEARLRAERQRAFKEPRKRNRKRRNSAQRRRRGRKA